MNKSERGSLRGGIKPGARRGGTHRIARRTGPKPVPAWVAKVKASR